MGLGKRRGGQGRAGGGEVEEKWECELEWEGGGGEWGEGDLGWCRSFPPSALSSFAFFP